ncbi:hypothetical protein [Paraglaciecola sp.]|uniref:hypothetical protein n=1 Tax=Paraglaciecola sp. TaxID=1920173 RepID=UPI0032971974
MRIGLTIILCAFFQLTGCSSMYPLPVDEKNITTELTKRKANYGLPVATNSTEVIKNLKDYSDWYFLKSNDLRERQFELSDTSLGFGVAGLIAGIAKSPEGAAAGALLASASEMPNDRYQLSVQAANYEKASDTMHCMYRYLVPYKANTNVFPDIDFINDRIYEIRRKLRKAQASVTLTSPDLTELEASLKAVIEQKPIEVTAQAAANNKALVDGALASAIATAIATANNEKKELLEKHLNTCVASFAG